MNQFNQWKTKTKKDRILLERCREVIKRIDPNADVILYGSVARGEAQDDSDYDLLVLTEII